VLGRQVFSNPVLITMSEGTVILMVVAAKFNSREAVITLISRTLKLEGVSSFFIKPLSVLVITVDPVKMLKLSEVSTVSKYSEG
jgi:hypothetical protein